MTPPATPSDPAARLASELLANVAWVHRLARALVGDAADAEDLAQETLRVSLTRPPDATARGARLRGWLARVARRLVIDRARSDSRRALREQATAPPDSSPEPIDVVARSARQQRVVQAVMALDEPFRTTVLLRWFDELPVREIASRMETNEALVRKRLERALARLRQQLDREFGSETKQWAGALLAFQGAAAMATKTKTVWAAAAAIAVLAVGTATWRWTATRRAKDPSATALAPAASAAPSSASASSVAATAQRNDEDASRDTVPTSASPRLAIEVVRSDGTACLEGGLAGFWSRSDSVRGRCRLPISSEPPEPLRGFERPIAGAVTWIDVPTGCGALFVAASAPHLRPSAVRELTGEELRNGGRFRLVVGEESDAPRFGGPVTVDGVARIPKGLSIEAFEVDPAADDGAAGAAAKLDVRIDRLASSWELTPRPRGRVILSAMSDETVPRLAEFGAEALRGELALTSGGALEVALRDLHDGRPLVGVDLAVASRFGASIARTTGTIQFPVENVQVIRSEADGIARLRGVRPASEGWGSIAIWRDVAPLAADPLLLVPIERGTPDPLRVELRLDLARPTRTVSGSLPEAWRSPRYVGEPPCEVAFAVVDGGSRQRLGSAPVAIDADGGWRFEVAPASSCLVWAERAHLRVSDLARVEVAAEDVAGVELQPRPGREVTLRIQGVEPPDSLALTTDEPRIAGPPPLALVPAPAAAGTFERRLVLDRHTCVTLAVFSKDGQRRRSVERSIEPERESVVEIDLSSPAVARKITFELVGAALPREAGLAFDRLDDDASLRFVEPSVGLDPDGRSRGPLPLAPGRWLWRLHSSRRGVVAGVVDVDAGSDERPISIRGEVEERGDAALERGFVVVALGDTAVPARLRLGFECEATPPGAGANLSPFLVSKGARIVARAPLRPVELAIDGFTVPAGASLHFMSFDREEPFGDEFKRVVFDGAGRLKEPLPLAPGRWFWRLDDPSLGGIVAGIVDIDDAASDEPIVLECHVERRRGDEATRGLRITRIDEIALPAWLNSVWLPRDAATASDGSFLVPARAETVHLDARR